MLRYTSRGGFPNDAKALTESGALFGGSVSPFSKTDCAESASEADTTVRCAACGGYWWPGCNWRGNAFWLCGLCGDECPLNSRMPSPDELREFCILYKDTVSEKEKHKPLAALFVLDLESEEALVDAALLAIGGALSALPQSYSIGLVVCADDVMSMYEFCGNSYQEIALRTRPGAVDGAFRARIADAVSLSNILCERSNLNAFVEALNAIKLDWRSKTTRHSSLGRSIEQLVLFLGNQRLLGARLLVFSSTTAKQSPHDLVALDNARSLLARAEVGVGIDLFHVASTLEYELHPAIADLIHASGGCAHEHSFAQLDDGTLGEQLKRRCERAMVFGGVIKTRTCPELSVLSSSASPTAHFGTTTIEMDANGGKTWWFVNLLKTLLNSLTGPTVELLTPAEHPKRLFLGKGQTLEGEGVWYVPMAEAEGFSLAFELTYTHSHGLSLFSFPRHMAVQVASTFMTSDGERFVRVETRSSESDRPVRSPNEIWHATDYKQMVFVTVRVLLFSGMYRETEYKGAAIAWASRIIKGGCGSDRFAKRMAKTLFGLVRLLEANDPNRIRLLGECNPDSLETLLWPRLSAFPAAIKNPPVLDLTLNVVYAHETSVLLEATSDWVLVLGDSLSPEEENFQRNALPSLARRSSFNDVSVHVLSKSQLRQMNDQSPMGLTPRSLKTRGRDMLMQLLLEEPTAEWPDGLNSFVQLVCGGGN